MKQTRSNQKPTPGDVVQIPLANGEFAFGLVLTPPLMAFFAKSSNGELSVNDIINSPIQFSIWVADSAITSKRWKVIGNSALDTRFDIHPWFFKQDSISGELSLYRGGVELAATYEECIGLERAAVWSAEHVESRLSDELNGKQNKWTESMRIKS